MPSWLALLAPLPDDVVAELKPVASADQLANGTAGPIAGWQSLSVHLSTEAGSRNVLVTIDESNTLLSAGDHVMLIREASRDGVTITIYDHESVGGRYADDGSFQGTRWKTSAERVADADDAHETTSVRSAPSDEDVEALNRIVSGLMRRL